MLVVFEPRSGASGDFRSYIMALVGLCSSRLDSSRPLRNSWPIEARDDSSTNVPSALRLAAS